MKQLLLMLALVTALLFQNSCSESTNPSTQNFSTNGKPALVIAVENRKALAGGMYEYGFTNYKTQTLEIFSDMFGVPVEMMKYMTLEEIIEKYGEEWQINGLINAADGHYQRIVVLTDEVLSAGNLIDSLKVLSGENYNIDMVFCLHGNSQSVCFRPGDPCADINDFTGQIISNNIKIRALYQTNCVAKQVIDEWEKTGIMAVNGAAGSNNITMFSPQYFLKEWISGKTYKEAVESAYNMEIEKLKTYKDILPIMEYILTDDHMTDSRQSTGGISPGIYWSQFPI